jgi:hypothetical protein
MPVTISGNGVLTGVAVGGLPDGVVDAGTLATNSVDSAELIDGAIDAGHLASGVGGKILQVVSADSGSQATLSSTTDWTTTGHSATITPSATSSKILVQVSSGSIYQGASSQNFSYYLRWYRNTTGLHHATYGFTGTYVGTNSIAGLFTRQVSHMFSDSPSSTSAQEYVLWHRTAQSGCTFYFNDSGTTTINLFEIGA